MPDEDGFAITAAWSGTDAVVSVDGDLDLAASAGWDACVSEVLGQMPTTLTLDLAGTTFVDSSGLRLLLLLTQQAASTSCAFSAINIPPTVARLLEITGLSDRIC